MTKLYYTDPLAAAYMSREFGVEYHKLGKIANWKVWQIDGEVDGAIFIDPKIMSHIDFLHDFGGKFSIHPDSLHIFEPQEGDYIYFDNEFGENRDEYGIGEVSISLWTDEVLSVRWGNIGLRLNECENVRIIQRNGKPFFWPEEEK